MERWKRTERDVQRCFVTFYVGEMGGWRRSSGLSQDDGGREAMAMGWMDGWMGVGARGDGDAMRLCFWPTERD